MGRTITAILWGRLNDAQHRVGAATDAGGIDSLAVIETYEFGSPALEAKVQSAKSRLRCPKCQNQNIADSMPIFRGPAGIVYEQLGAGASDEKSLRSSSIATVSL